eukprot:gene11911-15011_t
MASIEHVKRLAEEEVSGDKESYTCPEGTWGRPMKRILPPENEAPYMLFDMDRDGNEVSDMTWEADESPLMLFDEDSEGNEVSDITWDACMELALDMNISEKYKFAPAHPPPKSDMNNKNKNKNNKNKNNKNKNKNKKSPTPSPIVDEDAAKIDPNATFVPLCDGINWRLRFGAKVTTWGEPIPGIGQCYCYQRGSALAYRGDFKSDTISCMRGRENEPPPPPPPLSPPSPPSPADEEA